MSVCIAAFLGFAIYLLKFEIKEIKQTKRELSENQIEEIHVSTDRVIELNGNGNNLPVLAFDIGQDTVLLLQGSWIENPRTYGVKELQNEANEIYLNGLEAPHSFPSSEFKISRLLESGEITRIEICGDYVRPIEDLTLMKEHYRFRPSELLDGSFDELGRTLEEAHKTKQKC